MTRFCVAIIALLSAVPALSQSDSVRYEFPTTLVNATRSQRPAIDLSYALSVVEADTLGAPRPALSLEEVLRVVPGISVDNRHNLSQGDRISARGLGVRSAFGVRGIKVVLDGIPLTTADGQTQLNNLDIGSIGRIEILRGPNAALYGNASGGLLSIRTRQPTGAALRLAPRLLWGSDGLQRLQIQASGSGRSHHYAVGVHRVQSSGYREHAYGQMRGLNAIVHRRVGEALEVTALLNVHDAPYLFNPSSLDRATAETQPRSARSYIVSQGASKQVRQTQGGVSLRYRHGDESASNLVLYGLRRDLLNPIPGRIVELERSGGGLRYVRDGRWHRLRYTGGFDVDWQRDQRDEFVNAGLPDAAVGRLRDADVFARLQYGERQLDQREQVRSVGPFVSLDVPLNGELMLSISGRYDRYRLEAKDRLLSDGDDSGVRSLGQFSPFIGLNYRPHALLSVYANWATAFQTPTTNELSNRADGLGGFNPILDPERIRSVEGGLRARHPQWPVDAELSLYQLAIRDMLLPFQSESEETYFRNAGKARNRGLELALSATPSPRIELQGAYTYSRFLFVDYAPGGVQLADRQVPGLPPHRAFLSVRTFPLRSVSIGLEMEWVTDYFANDYNGPPPGSQAAAADFINEGYRRVDLRLGWQRAGRTIFAGVDNAFDTAYSGSVVVNAFGKRFFEPAAGRTFYIGGGWDGVVRE